VRRSLLFSNVQVNSYSLLEDSVILPDVSIGQKCRLRKVVVDKGCDIPDGTVIGEDREDDFRRFYVTPGGVVVVTAEMLGQELHYVR
jgi:glucose-1-phosphate adenylyltransferase